MTEHHYLPVREIRWFGAGIYELRLDRRGIAFTPGDCFALFAGDQQASRPYSVASGVADDFLAFIIRRMPGGELSDYLAGLKPGDKVKVSPPFGWFRPGNAAPGTPFVFVATGTGISPFMCHFRSRPEQPPDALLYGVREAADAVELDWLQRQCTVKLAVSRERDNGYHHGRVTDLLPGLDLRAESQYFLCGLDAMIDEVTVWLERQGVELPRIHRECFFNADFD